MIHGSIVALVTPFDEAGSIDFAAFGALLDFHIANGTSAVVVGGTTGESATLEPAEFEQLIAQAVKHSDGRIPIIAGTGSASTAHAIAMSRAAESKGADALLVVTPYYNRPTQAGLEAHYRAVADAVSIPVILYNVPTRTSVDLKPETTVALSSHPGIVGIKEAVADVARVNFLVEQCGPDFVVLSGDDPTFLEAMKAGARGVISVATNVAPKAISRICAAASAGDWIQAGEVNQQLQGLYETLALETNPIPVKWAAYEMGLVGPSIRLPLTPLSANHRSQVKECLAGLKQHQVI